MSRAFGMAAATVVLCGAGNTAGAQSSPPRVPLVRGLTLVTAVSDPPVGDYESIVTVTRIGADGGVTVTVAGEVPVPGSRKTDQVSVERRVLGADLKTGRVYKYYFAADDPVEFPGTTAFGTSADVLNDLRRSGRTTLGVNGERGGIGGLVAGALATLSGNGATADAGANASGVVRLVSPVVVPYSVLLDGRRVTLPAWHLKGRLGEGNHPADLDCFVLDDPANPIMLRYQIGQQRVEVVRIELPIVDNGNALEGALAADRRSVLYGVFFNFNSATLKPESDPVLREVVDVMRRQPGWKLRIEGHTDSVGGNAARNLELSAQRAQAVKTALVQRGIAAARLDTEGFGATVPRETNATLQGRARNRRVELSRE